MLCTSMLVGRDCSVEACALPRYVEIYVTKNGVVVDTSVVVDAFDEISNNNASSKRILTWLLDNDVTIHMPTYSIIEVSCALRNMKIDKRNMTNAFTNKYPLRCKYIDVDAEFLVEYFVPDLPYIRAGDYIFLCIANKLHIPLITNDLGLIRISSKCTFPVFSSEDAFLQFSE